MSKAPRAAGAGAERDPRPSVRLPAQGVPGLVIALVAGLLAIALFAILNHRRQALATGSEQAVSQVSSAFPPPPPLAMPAEPLPQPASPITSSPPAPQASPTPYFEPPPQVPTPPIMRASPGMPLNPPPFVAPQSMNTKAVAVENAPALVLDVGSDEEAPPGTRGAPVRDPAASSADAPVTVTSIRNQVTVIPSGTMIPAVLETPIDSARPGLVRAVVSEDARGFDGSRILVPRGSRLIGQYDADVRSGQNRVLVNWTRLVRPDGVAIRIGSPASDALGGSGVPGHVNSFFLRRFASAVLQSALAAGVNFAGRSGNGSVIVGLPTNNVGTIGQDLMPSSDLRPKITVKQGALINIFVAHDLDFAGAPRIKEPAR